MAKRTITLPHNVTLKVDSLENRTIRTIKDGDYLASTINVRGTDCHFYGRVIVKDAAYVRIEFGSHKMVHRVDVPKGSKVNVYRPI